MMEVGLQGPVNSHLLSAYAYCSWFKQEEKHHTLDILVVSRLSPRLPCRLADILLLALLSTSNPCSGSPLRSTLQLPFEGKRLFFALLHLNIVIRVGGLRINPRKVSSGMLGKQWFYEAPLTNVCRNVL